MQSYVSLSRSLRGIEVCLKHTLLIYLHLTRFYLLATEAVIYNFEGYEVSYTYKFVDTK